MGLPSLNFHLRPAASSKDIEPEIQIKEIIQKSIFNDYIQNIEVVDPFKIVDMAQDSAGVSQMRKSVKIITDHSSVVSGLKCLLHETASTLFTNLSEDYFNVDA